MNDLYVRLLAEAESKKIEPPIVLPLKPNPLVVPLKFAQPILDALLVVGQRRRLGTSP